MNNKIFFQHPDLTRCLAVHETVMQLMVQTLTKATLEQPESGTDTNVKPVSAVTADSVVEPTGIPNSGATSSPGVGSSGLPVVQEEGMFSVSCRKSGIIKHPTKQNLCPCTKQLSVPNCISTRLFQFCSFMNLFTSRLLT